jgi:hypothetical protein
VRRLFGRRETTPEADTALEKELSAETRAALAKARRVFAVRRADEVTLVAEAHEQGLVGYPTDNGMPGCDAVWIAQCPSVHLIQHE